MGRGNKLVECSSLWGDFLLKGENVNFFKICDRKIYVKKIKKTLSANRNCSRREGIGYYEEMPGTFILEKKEKKFTQKRFIYAFDSDTYEDENGKVWEIVDIGAKMIWQKKK
ncbi:MAG: hypothetical protein WC445_04980 [Patescibacteria group bacterium]